MGSILKKKRNKIKDFFGQGKKLVQPPKELPEINPKKQGGETPNSDRTKKHQYSDRDQKGISEPQESLDKSKDEKNILEESGKPENNLSIPTIKKDLDNLRKDASEHDEDMKQFEEAINSINIDMIHSEAPETEREQARKTENKTQERREGRKEKYYHPSDVGEGYFSEIEHYIKNKDVHEIIDDIISKDLLTNMKDYHRSQGEGRPFVMHAQDLEQKLKKRMSQLRELEEEWHALNKEITEKNDQKTRLEHEIDANSQELKDLFRQVKISQLLEKKAPEQHSFKLRSGQELKNLNDLRKALSYMDEEEFKSHVNKEKNDFARWVRDALQIKEVYEKIKDLKDKKEMQEFLKNPL